MAIALSGGSTNFTSTIEASPTTNRVVTVPDADFTITGNDLTQTLTNKTISSGVLTGTLTAGGSVGTATYVLTSTGTGVQWAPAAASGVTTISFASIGLTPATATSGAVTVGGTLVGTNGGTGVNNGSSTITIAGNLTHAGAYTQTFTATGNTSVTLPTTGTLATLDGTETFTNKTLTNPTVTNYVETPYTANSGASITLALTNGTFQIITLTNSAAINMPTAVNGKSFILLLRQDGTGSRTVTWNTVAWPSGTAPTLTSTASKQDMFSFFSDGTKWYGVTAGQNYTP